MTIKVQSKFDQHILKDDNSEEIESELESEVIRFKDLVLQILTVEYAALKGEADVNYFMF